MARHARFSSLVAAPGHGGLISVLHAVLRPGMASAILRDDGPLVTAAYRPLPMECGPNVDQTPNDSAIGGHGSGATRLWGEDRTARSKAPARNGACIGGHFDWMACANCGRSWWRWYDGEVRPEARSVALAAEYAQAEVRIWPKEKPRVRHRGNLRKCLFAGEGKLARLIACRPYPPCDDLDLTPIYQGHAPDEVHLVEDQAGGGARRDEDHFDVDPVTGAGERREGDIAWFGLQPRSQVGGRHDDAVAPTPALAETCRRWPDVHVTGRARPDEGLRPLV